MKKLLLLVTIFQIIVTLSYGQIPELKIVPNAVDTNIRGGVIRKGDTVQVSLMYTGVTSMPVRSFYIDLQHQYTAFTLVDVRFGNAVPTGAQSSYQHNYYPGYTFNKNASNTTESGMQNSNGASYSYSANSGKAINRIWLVSSGDLVNGKLCDIRFRVDTMQAGFAYDSLYYNFAQAFSGNYGGTYYDVKMTKPNSTWFGLSPVANALVNGEIKVVGNIIPQVVIVDSATSVVKATVTPVNGQFTLGSQLLPNTAYKAYVAVRSDSIPSILNRAITVSDYTAASTEFIKQNLDGTFSNSNIASGVGFLAADVNRNKTLDGGDVSALFAQAVGADTIFSAQSGQSIWNVPAFLTSTYDTLTLAGYRQLTDVYTVNFRTSNIATNLSINYLIPGDINRSHSSSFSVGYVNTTAKLPAEVDVDLNNITVTGNEFIVPIYLDTKGNELSALQFEFVYDESKVTFESILVDMPVWITFVNKHDGKIRFGAIDKEMKTPYKGTGLTPFILKFSAKNGLDINSSIKVTANMDASDNKGKQLGINLNTTTIKLTGYNNF
jgi:hypothetical protein